MVEVSEVREPNVTFVTLKVRRFRKRSNFYACVKLILESGELTHNIFKGVGKIRAVVVLGCEFGY